MMPPPDAGLKKFEFAGPSKMETRSRFGLGFFVRLRSAFWRTAFTAFLRTAFSASLISRSSGSMAMLPGRSGTRQESSSVSMGFRIMPLGCADRACRTPRPPADPGPPPASRTPACSPTQAAPGVGLLDLTERLLPTGRSSVCCFGACPRCSCQSAPVLGLLDRTAEEGGGAARAFTAGRPHSARTSLEASRTALTLSSLRAMSV
mmetsp:Transcript_8143/g.24167  ORF Transcript_8143/g.24167 Transcript_8143/m.24167 type:complete len:205 (+) Transcript_8143:1926-2540(+)